MSNNIGHIYPILNYIITPFYEDIGPGLCDLDDFKERQLPEPYFGELTLCILELVKRFNEYTEKNYPNNGKEKLRDEILALYDADWSHWWGFNSISKTITDKEQQDPFCGGLQGSCFVVWEEAFGDTDLDCEEEDHYHPEMLKFLIKRCVWDIFFPGETLPNYTEPSSGDITLLDFSV
jgi:hypothetical protein